MVHRPVSPGPLRLMCLRLISQALLSYIELRPRLEKYLALCGPQCVQQSTTFMDYVRLYFTDPLKEELLEFLTQLWFIKSLKIKQKTIEHERMSAGDPSHDHNNCGGTTSVVEAQRQTNLMAEILDLSLTQKTKFLRCGFVNARTGPVDFTRVFNLLMDKGSNLVHLDISFATDTLISSRQGQGQDSFNATFSRHGAALCAHLASINKIHTIKLLLCSKEMLKALSNCTRLQTLEMTEASLITFSDFATFSQGAVRHHLHKVSIRFWSDLEHLRSLCETQAPVKILRGMSSNAGRGRRSPMTLPPWAVFLLNCPSLVEFQWIDKEQIRPFNPLVGLLTLLRELKKWDSWVIENEGDLLDLVIEQVPDIDNLCFKWTSINVDSGNDGMLENMSESDLQNEMQMYHQKLPDLKEMSLNMFPGSPEFTFLKGLETCESGSSIAARLSILKIQLCQGPHMAHVRPLLSLCSSLQEFILQHPKVNLPQPAVLSVDIRDVLSFLPPSVSSLKLKGFHLHRRPGAEEREGDGPLYPNLRSLQLLFCGCSDMQVLHVSCLCPHLETLLLVVTLDHQAGAQGEQHQAQGLDASHLHSLCHMDSLVTCVVLVKAGHGWIQINDRERLGEFVLGSSSEYLRKIVLFPIRGVCAGGLRGLVKAAKEKNICLNIGVGNQRPMKSELNRRIGSDAFMLKSSLQEKDNFAYFGDFLSKKISEFEGQFWNDPDWFHGSVWLEENHD